MDANEDKIVQVQSLDTSEFETAPVYYNSSKDFINAESKKDAIHSRWEKTFIVIAVTCLVAFMNYYAIGFIRDVAFEEFKLISDGSLPPEAKSITKDVYLALIGATVAEVAAVFLIIVKAIFKPRN